MNGSSAVKIDASSNKQYFATYSFGRKTAQPVFPSMQKPYVNTGIYPSYLLISSSAKFDLTTYFLLVDLADFGHGLFVASSMVDSASNRFLYSIQIYIKSTTHILSSKNGLVDRDLSE
jgi:hypothetical protein